MNTTINQGFTFHEAKEIFKQLPNSCHLHIFFDSVDGADKVFVNCHKATPKQALMFLDAIDAECTVKVVSCSDSFEYALAYNSVMNPTIEPKRIKYTKRQEIEMWLFLEIKAALQDLENQIDQSEYYNK